MADHETSKLGGAEDQAAAAAEAGPPPGGGTGGARRRMPGIGAGAAIVVVAALFGGSIAFAPSATGDAADPGAGRPSAPAEAPRPPAADAPSTGSETPPAAESAAARTRPTTPGQAPTRAQSPPPEYVDGVPQVKATPAAGRVGARIRVEGYGFTDEHWAAPGAPLWLAQEGGCGLYAEATHTLRVWASGRLSGEFTVPARGSCRQSDRDDEPVVAGRYRLAYSCTACFIGEFRVISAPLAATPCRDVSFSPNSDDVASSIVARNMRCSAAEALVRKVGGPLGFHGPATAQADGFRCVRTGRDDQVLPVAYYRCTDGAKRVTFTRT